MMNCRAFAKYVDEKYGRSFWPTGSVCARIVNYQVSLLQFFISLRSGSTRKTCLFSAHCVGLCGVVRCGKAGQILLKLNRQAAPDLGDPHLGLRGFCGLEITVIGASKDLHSGTFGGAVPNPAQVSTRALALLYDKDGEIAVPGFMSGTTAPTQEERRVFLDPPFDRAAWLNRAGLADAAVPADFAADQKAGLYPAIEIDALEAGGYAGGMRYTIPREASARLSCRLVPGQDLERIALLLHDFLDHAIPTRFGRHIAVLPERSLPYRIGRDHPFQKLAADVLEAVDGRPPRYSFSGGSIPISGAMAAALGVETLIFGFGLQDENMHRVDEFCRLSDIERSMKAWPSARRCAASGDLMNDDALQIN